MRCYSNPFITVTHYATVLWKLPCPEQIFSVAIQLLWDLFYRNLFLGMTDECTFCTQNMLSWSLLGIWKRFFTYNERYHSLVLYDTTFFVKKFSFFTQIWGFFTKERSPQLILKGWCHIILKSTSRQNDHEMWLSSEWYPLTECRCALRDVSIEHSWPAAQINKLPLNFRSLKISTTTKVYITETTL